MKMVGPSLFFLVLLSACGNYSDFTLPPLASDGPIPGWRAEVKAQPVLDRGAPGEWDSVDVLNPAVVRRNGQYFCFYSGFDGTTWHTGLATSPDGLEWSRQGSVLSPDGDSWEGAYIAANGTALDRDGVFHYWYQAGDPPRIGLARSPDGRHWNREPAPVLGLGPRGSWDERGVADPYVIEAGSRLYMFYLGQDRARRQRLGVAVSDDGVDWWKLRPNPVLELGPPGAFDETGLGEPAVWSSHGRYWMLYTARDRREVRRLGLAISTDGVDWERVSPHAFLSGEQDWNAAVICDPTVEVNGAEVRMWFGGGDQPRPDERLNGQIGFAVLSAEQ